MHEPMPSSTSNLFRPGLLHLVLGLGVLLVLALLPWPLGGPAHAASPFVPGDLVLGLGSSPDGSSQGKLRHFSPSGTLLDTLLTTSGSFEETGPCFDAAYNLFTTNFEADSVSKFGSNGSLLNPGFATNLDRAPNSCIVDAAGNVYIGLSDRGANTGGGGLVKLSAAGVVLDAFQPAPDQRGTDWIDLAADQCTLFYTSLGDSIKRYNVCTRTQLPDFCTACDDGNGGSTSGAFFALRLLPDGGVLVADFTFEGNGRVRRYNSAGTQVQYYVAANIWGSFCGPDGDQPCFFPWALGLDPDLGSFWVADYISGEVFKFDLASGGVQSSFQAGNCDDFYSSCAVTGLAIAGEPTAATTGGGSVSTVTATITAANKVYDTTPGATITSCTLTGVQPADVGNVGCATTGGAFADANVGSGKPVSAAVTLTGTAAGNYILAAASATTTANITPAPASVTPNPASKTYGGPDPTFSGSLSGFLESVTATYSRTTGESVAGSPYTISATLSPASVLGNYAITHNTAAFTIGRANASVTPNAASKPYGAADPGFGGTLSGFVASDGVTAVYTRTAGETVAGSPYTISASLSPAAALSNYNIAYNTAAFAITPATASVTPNPATKTYGTADPVLTGTLSGFLATDGVTATYGRTAGETVAGGPYAISATLSPASALGNYSISNNAAAFTITPATPIVTWADPADITYPTPLSGTQLNATADVPGAFAYSPPSGTVLSPGNNQLLSVLFTPTDNSDYTTATAQVHINVLPTDVSVAEGTPIPVINVGDTATYNLVVTANGPGNSSNVVLTDELPTGLTWTVSGPDAGACSPSSPVLGGETLTCSFGALAAGTTRNITLTAVTTTTGCGEVVNTASVTATGDSNTTNNSAGPVTITVNCPAIAISKSTSTPTVVAGDTVSYKVTVTAGGSGDSTNVTMTDVLPAGLTWMVGGADAADCSPASPLPGGSTLTCSYDTLAPGEKRTVVLTAATTTANCGTISNSATVTDTLDTSPGDNSAGPVMITVACPDVSVAVSTSTPAITAGSNATYTVVVTANGPGIASAVTLNDTLPSGLSWTVGGADGSVCLPTSPVAGGMNLSCNFGALAAGATRTITLTAATTTANCGVIKNTATVNAAGDTNSSNNSSGPVSIAVACPAPPSVTSVTLSCPNVSLVGAAIAVSGAVSPASSMPVGIQYTSPSGVGTSHVTTSSAAGTYSDSLTAPEVGQWTVQATAGGMQSPVCPIIVYGKSVGGTFVVGDISPYNAGIGATADFWGSQWWTDNVWSGGVNPGVASLKGYLDAVDLPGNCGGSWSTRPGNSSKPPATIPEYMAVIVSSTISKNGSTIAGDVVAEVIVKTSPGYGPAPGHDGYGTIVAVRCHK